MTEPREQQPTRSRRGSEVSDRQINYAVKHGRKVTAILGDNVRLSGWVMGVDDYHWVVVTEDSEVHLVHKSAPALSIESKGSLDSAPKQVQDMVKPFREKTIEQYFTNTSPRQRS